jgi:hypothetical protein
MLLRPAVVLPPWHHCIEQQNYAVPALLHIWQCCTPKLCILFNSKVHQSCDCQVTITGICGSLVGLPHVTARLSVPNTALQLVPAPGVADFDDEMNWHVQRAKK